jgi:hypothetical protein
MVMKRVIFCGMIVMLLQSGCAIQPLQYVSHSPLNIAVSLQQQEAIITTNIHFFNPNGISGKVRSGKLDVFLGPSAVGSITLDTLVRVKGKSTFALPVEFTTTGAQILGASRYAKGFFTGNANLPYSIEGDMQIAAFLLYRKSIPVFYADSLLLKDIKGIRL